MSTSTILFKPAMLVLLLCSGVLATFQAQAAFLADAEGQVVTSADGNCVHTGDWQPAMGSCPESGVRVLDGPASLQFALQGAGFFGFDQDRLSTLARAHLYPLVVAARDADSVLRVIITGHADPMGATGYNRDLSRRRAQAVWDYLVGEGLPAGRIRLASAGERNPLVRCTSRSSMQQRIRCLAPDRRVDVVAVLRDNLTLSAASTGSPRV